MTWTLWKHVGVNRREVLAEGNCPITFLGDPVSERVVEAVS